MRPRVILSNAISPNGSLTGFHVDYGVYYPLLLSYKPDAVLVGADAVLAAPVEIPPEQESDRLRRPSEQESDRLRRPSEQESDRLRRPSEQESDRLRRPSEQGETRPWWVIVDSRGRLSSVLHFFRRMEYVRDIIVLVSEKTPPEYIRYLRIGTISSLLQERRELTLRLR